MLVVGYVRVSTTEQAEDGFGLAAQESIIRQVCDLRGWELLRVHRDEGISGKDLGRPGLHAALTELAGGGARGLVVAKLDRLTRSSLDFGLLCEWFEEADAALLALDLGVDTSTPAGKLVANVMAAMAEWERGTIAERTRAGLEERRRQGLSTSRPAVHEDLVLTDRIRRMRAGDGNGQGPMSLQAICDVLNREGVPTPRGGATWRPSSLQSVIGYRRRKPRKKIAALPEVRRR